MAYLAVILVSSRPYAALIRVTPSLGTRATKKISRTAYCPSQRHTLHQPCAHFCGPHQHPCPAQQLVETLNQGATDVPRSVQAAFTIAILLFFLSAANAATLLRQPWATTAQPPKPPGKPANRLAALKPGDTILFQRGGEARKRLYASVSGEDGKPITYDAYGDGPKPKFRQRAPGYHHPSPSARTTTLQHRRQGRLGPPGPCLYSQRLDQRHPHHHRTRQRSHQGRQGLHRLHPARNVIYMDHRNHLVFRNSHRRMEIVGQIQVSDGRSGQGYGIRVSKGSSATFRWRYGEAYLLRTPQHRR